MKQKRRIIKEPEGDYKKREFPIDKRKRNQQNDSITF
jgi:hypothetical protein